MSTIREKTIDYLSRREHSRLELKQKLLIKKFPIEEINTELDFLMAKDLQSDERFAHAYARSRKQSGFGPRRIEYELRERGISESLISEAVDARSPQWRDEMIAVWQRKFSDASNNKSESARQFRFLSQRGFPSEMITKHLFS